MPLLYLWKFYERLPTVLSVCFSFWLQILYERIVSFFLSLHLVDIYYSGRGSVRRGSVYCEEAMRQAAVAATVAIAVADLTLTENTVRIGQADVKPSVAKNHRELSLRFFGIQAASRRFFFVLLSARDPWNSQWVRMIRSRVRTSTPAEHCRYRDRWIDQFTSGCRAHRI